MRVQPRVPFCSGEIEGTGAIRYTFACCASDPIRFNSSFAAAEFRRLFTYSRSYLLRMP